MVYYNELVRFNIQNVFLKNDVSYDKLTYAYIYIYIYI
jgi:hypothetical protein